MITGRFLRNFFKEKPKEEELKIISNISKEPEEDIR